MFLCQIYISNKVTLLYKRLSVKAKRHVRDNLLCEALLIFMLIMEIGCLGISFDKTQFKFTALLHFKSEGHRPVGLKTKQTLLYKHGDSRPEAEKNNKRF